MARTVHIIGAGLAGLSAAVRLTAAGRRVVVHEATAFAGGRCRSYHDASVGMTIDNGNHLLLSGNRAALGYLRSIGAEHRLIGPPSAEFSFADLAGGERWTLRFNDGPIPFWVFDPKRRVPGTGVLDYLPLARLLWAPAGKSTLRVHLPKDFMRRADMSSPERLRVMLQKETIRLFPRGPSADD